VALWKTTLCFHQLRWRDNPSDRSYHPPPAAIPRSPGDGFLPPPYLIRPGLRCDQARSPIALRILFSRPSIFCTGPHPPPAKLFPSSFECLPDEHFTRSLFFLPLATFFFLTNFPLIPSTNWNMRLGKHGSSFSFPSPPHFSASHPCSPIVGRLVFPPFPAYLSPLHNTHNPKKPFDSFGVTA